MRCSGMRCSETRYSGMRCGGMMCTEMMCGEIRCGEIRCSEMRCNEMGCSGIGVHSDGVQWDEVLRDEVQSVGRSVGLTQHLARYIGLLGRTQQDAVLAMLPDSSNADRNALKTALILSTCISCGYECTILGLQSKSRIHVVK